MVTTLPPMGEKEWQGQIVELARRLGYEFIYHTWRSDHSPAGYPDLIILRDGIMIVAEVKREDGKLMAEQYSWLLAFLEITPAVYLWKPSDWDEVVEVLQRYRGKGNHGQRNTNRRAGRGDKGPAGS